MDKFGDWKHVLHPIELFVQVLIDHPRGKNVVNIEFVYIAI